MPGLADDSQGLDRGGAHPRVRVGKELDHPVGLLPKLTPADRLESQEHQLGVLTLQQCPHSARRPLHSSKRASSTALARTRAFSKISEDTGSPPLPPSIKIFALRPSSPSFFFHAGGVSISKYNTKPAGPPSSLASSARKAIAALVLPLDSSSTKRFEVENALRNRARTSPSSICPSSLPRILARRIGSALPTVSAEEGLCEQPPRTTPPKASDTVASKTVPARRNAPRHGLQQDSRPTHDSCTDPRSSPRSARRANLTPTSSVRSPCAERSPRPTASPAKPSEEVERCTGPPHSTSRPEAGRKRRATQTGPVGPKG